MVYQYLSSDWSYGEREALLHFPEQVPNLREKWLQTRWGSPDCWFLDTPEVPEVHMKRELDKQAKLIAEHGDLAKRYFDQEHKQELKAAEEWLAEQAGQIDEAR